MCVIIGGLRKNLRRDEQLEGMRTNPSGFAIAVLREKKLIAHKRSLDKDEIMKIWDEAKDDDYIVTHSRIPSMGGLNANIDDCHLWEREGCLLAHNGTMTNMKDIMEPGDKRTDSLVFFEDLFIPIWKSQGRKINALVENVIKTDTHGSRICIITPDGEVHYYGDWVKDHDCMMSNRSYKTFTPTSGYSTSRYGYGYGNYTYQSDYFDDDYPYGFGSKTTKDDKKDDKKNEAEEYDGSVLMLSAGKDLARYLLTHYLTDNICALAASERSDDDSQVFEDCYNAINGLMSSPDSVLMMNFMEDDLRQFLTEPKVTDREIRTLLEEFSSACETEFCPDRYSGVSTVSAAKTTLEEFRKAIKQDEIAAGMLNTSFDWNALTLNGLVTSWTMTKNARGIPSMKTRDLTDILCYDIMSDTRPADLKKTTDIVIENLAKLFDAYRKGVV